MRTSDRYLCGLTHRSLDEVKNMLAQDRIWYKSQNAAQIVENFTNRIDSVSHSSDNMVQYICSRSPEISSDISCKSNSALRALSAMLTTPLTVAHALQIVSRHSSYRDILQGKSEDIANSNSGRVSVALLGARAEALLPLHWWREMLLHLHMQQPHKDIKHDLAACDILLIGPELPTNMRPIRTYGGNGSRLVAPSSFRAPYSQPLHKKLAPFLSAAVLMNPGIGSPSLKSLWSPSLRQLLLPRHVTANGEDAKSLPIVLTAHCSGDLARDVAALESAAKSVGRKVTYLLEPTPNPFASLLPTVDTSNEAITSSSEEHDMRLIWSNSFLYVIAAD